MNIDMLKYMVELSGGEVDLIDSKAFFDRFPRDISSSELYSLKNRGFISLVSADDQITEIGVNKKAIDYLKNLPS